MLVTETHSDFFSPLSGANGKIVEQTIISLYAAIYGNDFIVEDVLDRKKVRNIIFRVVQEIPWQKDESNITLNNDLEKANYIIKRLENCGWITFITDKGLSIRTFNFTKNGKKFAQMLFSLSDEEHLIVRQRNVRSTKASLSAYMDSRDPADLIDAINSSKYIVSDLTDNINDLKEEKNSLMLLAMKDIDEAGGKFIGFLEDKFATNLAVKFGEDSAIKHQLDIITIIDELLFSEDFNKRETKLKDNYSIYREKDEALKDILYAIKERLINACDSKLPQLKREISTYIQRGEIVFRQANSLMFNKNQEVNKIAQIIKEKSFDEKEELLSEIGKSIKFSKLKILNLSNVKIKKRPKKNEIVSFIESEKNIPKEVYIRSNFEQKKHDAFNFTQSDIKNFIEKHFEGGKKEITNESFKIKDPKELLISLYAADIMYQYSTKKEHDFSIEYTNNRIKNDYFETDEFVIKKGK